MGNNPNNFTNLIRLIIIGTIPQADTVIQQDQAIRNLEQLSISKFDYINEFSRDFMRNIALTNRALDDSLADKYFQKLPGTLGKQIHDDWIKHKGISVKARVSHPSALVIVPS